MITMAVFYRGRLSPIYILTVCMMTLYTNASLGEFVGNLECYACRTDPCDFTKVVVNQSNLLATWPTENAEDYSVFECKRDLSDTSNAQDILVEAIPTELGGFISLTKIVIEQVGGSGRIPSEIGLLTELRSLHLSRNHLSGRIPTQIGVLTKLTILDLYDNDLTGSIPTQLGGLLEIKYFELYSNRLNGTIPSQLGMMRTVTRLDIEENYLTGTLPDELGDLRLLLELDMGRNLLSGEIPAAMGRLNVLEYLDISYNKFVGFEEEFREDAYQKLQLLRMTHNEWICDCKLIQWITDELELHHIESDVYDAECGPKNSFHGLPVGLVRNNPESPCLEPIEIQFENVTSRSKYIKWFGSLDQNLELLLSREDGFDDHGLNETFVRMIEEVLLPTSEGACFQDCNSFNRDFHTTLEEVNGEWLPVNELAYPAFASPLAFEIEWEYEDPESGGRSPKGRTCCLAERIKRVQQKIHDDEADIDGYIYSLFVDYLEPFEYYDFRIRPFHILMDYSVRDDTEYGQPYDTIKPYRSRFEIGPFSQVQRSVTGLDLPGAPPFPSKNISRETTLQIEFDFPPHLMNVPREGYNFRFVYQIWDDLMGEPLVDEYGSENWTHTESEFFFGNLIPNSSYSIRGLAKNVFGESDWSQWKHFTTAPVCPPGLEEQVRNSVGADGYYRACIPCPMHTFYTNFTTDGSVCNACPAEFPITLQTASVSPDDCGVTEGRFVHYFPNGRRESFLCIDGMICTEMGLKTTSVGLESGFWREDITSKDVLRCPFPEFCVGTGVGEVDERDSVCASNHTGVFCADCDKGMVRGFDGVCYQCTEEQKSEDSVRLAIYCIFLLALALIVVGKNFGLIIKAKCTVLKNKNMKRDCEEKLKRRMDKVNRKRKIQILDTRLRFFLLEIEDKILDGNKQGEGALEEAEKKKYVLENYFENTDYFWNIPEQLVEGTANDSFPLGYVDMIGSALHYLRVAFATKLRILIGFYQIAHSLKVTFKMLPIYEDMDDTNVLDIIVSFDLSELYRRFDAACAVESGYFVELLLYTILPVLFCCVVVVVHMLTACLLRQRYDLKQKTEDANSNNTIESLTAKKKLKLLSSSSNDLWYIVLVLLFTIYPGVSRKILESFVCDNYEIAQQSVLRADPRVDCNSSEYIGVLVYSSVMVLVYPVGVLVFYLLLLRQNKRILKMPRRERTDEEEAKVSPTVFLHEVYKSSAFWFEAYELARKVLLVSFTVMVYETSTESLAGVIWVIALSFLSLIILVVVQPYRRAMDFCFAILTNVALISIGFIMLSAQSLPKINDGWKSLLASFWYLEAGFAVMLAIVDVERIRRKRKNLLDSVRKILTLREFQEKVRLLGNRCSSTETSENVLTGSRFVSEKEFEQAMVSMTQLLQKREQRLVEKRTFGDLRSMSTRNSRLLEEANETMVSPT